MRGKNSVLAEQYRPHSSAGNPSVIDELPEQDSPDGEIDARVLAPLYSSADRRVRTWEDIALDSFACNSEDHPVTRHDESDITAPQARGRPSSLFWTLSTSSCGV